MPGSYAGELRKAMEVHAVQYGGSSDRHTQAMIPHHLNYSGKGGRIDVAGHLTMEKNRYFRDVRIKRKQ
jgi:hypothetical protein